MDWFNISMKLATEVLTYLNTKEAKKYLEKKLELEKRILDEEDKHINERDMSVIDKCQRELFLLCDLIQRESTAIKGQNAATK